MSIRWIVVSFSLGISLTAQVHNREVALKNWPAPLYWQPSQAEIASRSQAGGTVSLSLVFVAITPCRVVDTRASSMFPAGFGQPSLTNGVVRNFPIQSSTLCTIPTTAQAYSFNVTLVPPGPVGFLTLWPEGQTQPNVVTLDDVQGQIANNAAIVPAGSPNGGISAITNGATDLVLDINGYYVPLYPNFVSNTASGNAALPNNTTGVDNTADGTSAMYFNSTGSDNTAIGANSLNVNETGGANTAVGSGALSKSNGGSNTGIGYQALYSNQTGGGNIALGYSAGYNITGSNNIDIASLGVAGESGVTRIGDGLQIAFFASGISGVNVTGRRMQGRSDRLKRAARYRHVLAPVQGRHTGYE